MRRLVPVNLDLALLVLRVVLAAVMLAHGLPKVTGFAGIAGFFASAGIPAPTLAAAYATVVEVGGGVLILLGVAVDIAGLLFAVDMIGAIVFVHIKNGFSGQGGFEFPLTLLAAAVTLALAGPGAFSVGGRK
jgi:putative oxidoreductase